MGTKHGDGEDGLNRRRFCQRSVAPFNERVLFPLLTVSEVTFDDFGVTRFRHPTTPFPGQPEERLRTL